MQDFEKVDKCLLCNGYCSKVISFGKTALANEFLSEEEFNLLKNKQDTFDLTIINCNDCNHIQLDTCVNEDRLYRNYLYVSGTSKVNVQHFDDYAKSVAYEFCSGMNLTYNVIDIASNDGTFLKSFKNSGCNINCIGVEPAKNIAAEANKKYNFLTIPEFFNKKTAQYIEKELNVPSAYVITCNNCFAHNKDLSKIMEGVDYLLDDTGVFIIENSYLIDVLDKGLYDLFYHEHMHTLSISPLNRFFNKFGMEIFRVKRIDNHGGSFRAYVCRSNKRKIESSVKEAIDNEKNIDQKILNFVNNLDPLKDKLNKAILNIKSSGKSIGIYGYPAKATSLVAEFEINLSLIDFVCDDAILKIGKYCPGTNIKVESPSSIYEKKPDYMLILGWNFAPSIIKKCQDMGYKGKFIVLLPEFRVYNNDGNLEN